MFQNGNGVEEDLDQAIYWYTKAANQGYVDAQYNLATIYENNNFDHHLEQAAYWYYQAALQGNACAQYNLAKLYESGIKIEDDSMNSIYWYKKSAENGYPKSQYRLAELYITGNNVCKNINIAEKLLLSAIKGGNTDAKTYLYQTKLKQFISV